MKQTIPTLLSLDVYMIDNNFDRVTALLEAASPDSVTNMLFGGLWTLHGRPTAGTSINVAIQTLLKRLTTSENAWSKLQLAHRSVLTCHLAVEEAAATEEISLQLLNELAWRGIALKFKCPVTT